MKLQLVIAEELVHPRTGAVSLPGGAVDLYRRFRAVERDPEFYAEIRDHAEAQGLLFLCTAFGVGSARILRDIGCRAIKIASPELGHVPLLREVATYRLPLILSSGVSRMGDIEAALDIVGEAAAAVLHCVTAYPAPEEDYNLRLIPALAVVFGVPFGVSDHTMDPILVPTAAAALGAVAVEKHFTLSRKGAGLDDPIALEPDAFSAMCASVRRAQDPGVMAALRDRYGQSRLQAVLGTGIKRLAPSEAGNYLTTNRSIMAATDLAPGERLTEENVAVLRSEKNLSPGLRPELLDVILGRAVIRAVPAGRGITWDDLMPPARSALA